MSSVTELASGHTLPGLTLTEFAVLLVLLRRGTACLSSILEPLADVFGERLEARQLQPAIRRLIHLQLVDQDKQLRLTPHPRALEPAARSFETIVRIASLQFREGLNCGQLSLFEARDRTVVEDGPPPTSHETQELKE